ncbi:MAG: hypothetical protein ACLRQF_16150 [Thomasclavelia ramosa]
MPESGQYVIHICYNTAVQQNIYSHAVNFWPSDTTIDVVNNRIMGKISVDKLVIMQVKISAKRNI